MTLGSKLKELREAKGLVQREVGAVIGLDGTYISKIEKNDKSVNRDHLSVLADFFSCDENELQTLWLADKLYRIIREEEFAKASVQIVLERLN